MRYMDNISVTVTTPAIADTTRVYENAGPVTILFILGVLGNAAAFGVVCCNAKTHKWRPFQRYVLALVISDGGGILASYPFAEYRYISKFTYTFPKPLCEYVGFVFMFTLMSSAMIVCCMSFDRFFATFYPFLYNSPSKGLRTNIILGIVWCLSGILSSLHLYGLGSSKNIYPGSWCFLNFIEVGSEHPHATENRVYSYLYAITGLTVVTLTIVANVAVAIYFIRNRFFRSRPTSGKRDVQIIIFVLVVAFIFGSLWAPLMINILQHASGAISGEDVTELILLRMGVSNSVLDPWIYILLRKEILVLILRAVEIVTNQKLRIVQNLTGNDDGQGQRASINQHRIQID